ncbi:MAG TPA: 30S ribosomal protein S17 [Candidatus Dormibacteraeota bacterium]
MQTTETPQPRTFRKVRVGRVISDKMEKTVVVEFQDLKSHPLYKKVLKHRVRFKAHDEQNQCKVGDLVRIAETRPISKEKRWRVVEIVEKAR